MLSWLIYALFIPANRSSLLPSQKIYGCTDPVSCNYNPNATLDDGSKASDRKTFRIKDIPKPTGTIAGKDGLVRLPKRNVEIGTVSAKLDDFVFDLPIQVTSFKIKVPGQPTVNVAGTKMNGQAKSAIQKARRGDNITIFDIKAKIQGNAKYRLKNVSPVIVEVTN